MELTLTLIYSQRQVQPHLIYTEIERYKFSQLSKIILTLIQTTEKEPSPALGRWRSNSCQMIGQNAIIFFNVYIETN